MREILTRLTASLRLVSRARVLLMAGDGMANSQIAERSGLSVGTGPGVARPHQVDTFKPSNDRPFEEMLIDVVGL